MRMIVNRFEQFNNEYYMRKILLTLVLLTMNIVAKANHWTAATAYDYPSSTPVYARVVVNGEVVTDQSGLEIAAFIGDDCRASTTETVQSGLSSQSFYLMRVMGDEDDVNKTISFKVYYQGLEYAVTPSEEVVFDKESHIALNFFVDALTGVSLTDEIKMVGELPLTVSLMPLVTLKYENSNGDNTVNVGKSELLSELKYTWSLYSTTAFSVSDDVLTISSECVGRPLGLTITGPIYSDTQFRISTSTNVTGSYPVSFNFPSAVEVDKFGMTFIRISNVVGAVFDPSLVTFKFEEIGGVPVAVGFYSDMKYGYYVYGNMASISDFKVLYDGVSMTSTEGSEKGQIKIESSVSLNSGWNWISLYSVDEGDNCVSLVDQSSGSSSYYSWLTKNVNEIRSQFGILYNDATYGVFGDIDNLNMSDGMYKVKAKNKMSFVSGCYAAKSFDNELEVHKGYNWFNNPYQLDVTIDQISSSLNSVPSVGDRIIGKESFIEYNGSSWEGPEDFLLQAGAGYMYYSVNTDTYPLSFNSNLQFAVSSSLNTDVMTDEDSYSGHKRSAKKASATDVWNYDNSSYADNMTIVAVIDNLTDLSDYSLGAFVGDECRGEGKLSESGKLFINVGGKSGDNVRFRMINKSTGELFDVDGSVTYSDKAGSLDNPLILSIGDVVTQIDDVELDNVTPTALYDMTGRRVSEMTKGVYVAEYDINGTIITKKITKR